MRFRLAFACLAVPLAACSGGGSGTPGTPGAAPTATPTVAAGSHATPTPTPGASQSPGTGVIPSSTPSATAPAGGASPTATPLAGAPTPHATPQPTAVPTATPSAGASPSSSPNVLVVSRGASLPISPIILGANMAGWVDITEGGLEPALASTGFTATRWPGGSESDQYHWATNTSCNDGYTATNSTFDNFENDIAKPANLDVAITLDYGSNAACNGGGDPSEAAAWVAHAKAQNDNVHYWTVGNEEYGSWEYDLHSSPHDPTTYANALATGFYPQIKAADPNALVGAVVEGSSAWDSTVLANAKYDFVELHFYFGAPGQENDTTLLQQGAPALTSAVKGLKAELASAGRASTPIYVGEIGSVYTNPGKQAMSITQGLFAGMVLGELMNDGVARATWWLAYGGCTDASSGANFSPSLYGWQNFGGYMILSDGTPEYGCPNATAVPRGTPFPTARAYQLMAQVARSGERVFPVTIAPGNSYVRAYAASHGSGYAVVLFNLDETSAHTVTVGVDQLGSGSAATLTTYGKAQYDQSQQNQWPGPTSANLGSWHGNVSVSLPAWSMNVLQLSP